MCGKACITRSDLPRMLAEIARVLRPGGVLLACREHVVDDYGASLEAFLPSQVDHQLYGGEHAFTLPDYRAAMLDAGLDIRLQFGPYDSVINAYPNTPEVLRRKVLASRPGRMLRKVLPDDAVAAIGAWRVKRRKMPGRMYTFVAVKPATEAVMLNALIPHVMRLRTRFPGLYARLVALARRFLGARLGIYPRPLAAEVAAVTSVLRGSQWNMTAGKGLAHERLEASFADYVGVPYAIAVNTGGMALQMSMRALGLKPGDEVVHQVDTCSATALAVMAAGCTPLFADISERTLMIEPHAADAVLGPRTRALIATHMWGNPEDMPSLQQLARERGLHIIEDACLSLGTTLGGGMAGSFGKVGVFSFGCIKPIQGGEGGMIVTRDESLARELRAMRHWGDRTIEYGVRDTLRPAWNGRLSEIVAAVVHEQLKGYPRHLASMRAAVGEFHAFLARIDGLDLVFGHADAIEDCAFTQVVLRVDKKALGRTKGALKDALYARGIPVWHANFEPISSLTLFREAGWEDWMPAADLERARANYRRPFPMAQRVFDSTGLGLGKMNFLSRQNLRHLMKQIEALCMRRAA